MIKAGKLIFPTGRYLAFFYCKEVRKRVYFCTRWCVSAASSLIYHRWTLLGSGQGRGRDFCLPPARSSSAETDVYFQEGAVIIAVELQRKWIQVVSGLFVWRPLVAPAWPRGLGCFVWLPVVNLLALLFKRRCTRKEACEFLCLQAAFGEGYKYLSLHVGYLVNRECTVYIESKLTLLL